MDRAPCRWHHTEACVCDYVAPDAEPRDAEPAALSDTLTLEVL